MAFYGVVVNIFNVMHWMKVNQWKEWALRVMDIEMLVRWISLAAKTFNFKPWDPSRQTEQFVMWLRFSPICCWWLSGISALKLSSRCYTCCDNYRLPLSLLDFVIILSHYENVTGRSWMRTPNTPAGLEQSKKFWLADFLFSWHIQDFGCKRQKLQLKHYFWVDLLFN